MDFPPLVPAEVSKHAAATALLGCHWSMFMGAITISALVVNTINEGMVQWFIARGLTVVVTRRAFVKTVSFH